MGRRLPGLLLLPAGFAVVVVAGGIATAVATTAPWATPLVVALAVAGFGLSFPWVGRRLDRWAAAAAVGVFAIYAAPVALSGLPTFAGYIKLDDTATWMAFVDRLMQHGRSLSGLGPSSYETTLSVNLSSGYPVGAFLPLGVGTQLSGDDVAWLVQPYMALMAGLLALCLAQIARPLIASRRLAALVAFGAAQPALLFGYSLWGGVKEVAIALSLATLAALASLAIDHRTGWQGVSASGSRRRRATRDRRRRRRGLDSAAPPRRGLLTLAPARVGGAAGPSVAPGRRTFGPERSHLSCGRGILTDPRVA